MDKYGQLIIPIFISKIKENNELENVIKCEAIIDTDANISAISNKIIQDLKLILISKGHINNILSSEKTEIEYFNIWIGIILNEEKIFGKLENGKKLNNQKEIKEIMENNPDLVKWFQAKVVGTKWLNKKEIDKNCLIGTDLIQEGHLSISNDTFIFSI